MGAGTNTVRNSSFESGLPAGTFGFGGTVSAAAGSPAHDGTQVARMQATTNGTMDVGNDSSRLAVSAGEKITLSAYGRTAREIRVAARFYNASGAFMSRVDAGSVAGQHHRVAARPRHRHRRPRARPRWAGRCASSA